MEWYSDSPKLLSPNILNLFGLLEIKSNVIVIPLYTVLAQSPDFNLSTFKGVPFFKTSLIESPSS